MLPVSLPVIILRKLLLVLVGFSMSVGIGTHLGSIEITALLGRGGMGIVYRARDMKLKRDVAIKILPGGILTGSGPRQPVPARSGGSCIAEPSMSSGKPV